MKKCKKLLCLLLVLATVVSLFAVCATANAAPVEVVEVSAATPTSASDFTWDNATVYFLLTDRFNNGNTSNDHSYNRGLLQNGSVASTDTVASFQGGDFAGITKKINEGYFDDLGVNAIWVGGWFEQIHGYVVGSDAKKSFPHYAYHGYYGLDFTELDKNYGTEAEFKQMVEAAHKKGIRIVLDVVMNHPGYNTIYDMNEYGFGTLKSGWESVYYNFSSINQTNYHAKVDYNSNSNDWAKWWGTNWIRAGLAGYAEGYGDLQGSQVYLPDFKTESTSTVDIPQILKTKWNKEGTYNSKVSEINSTFSKYSLGSKTVTNYLVAWYAKWVEEYGIDGFRCDTAKHVDQSSWKKLSDTCTQALKNWRNDNPSAAGANWDEDFWMTGENWGQGVDKNQYYTNGFDSMINFSFSADNQGNNANGMKKSSNINSTYADYANRINSDSNFNVLTYISSHDTGLCRDDLYYQASSLLLLPGGVQIFYGDETDRDEVNCIQHDHEMRSFMNWSEISNSSSSQSQVLAHWQKVGQFRNNHVAVGAGSHTTLSATSGAAFARTYNKSSVTDKVVCVIGANNNTNVTITLNNTFANGTVLKNTYTGATATVSGGKVTVNSGAHGTILLEEDTTTVPTTTTTEPPVVTTTTEKPVVPTTTKPVTPAEKVLLGDADLDGIVAIKDVSLIQKHSAKLETLTGKAAFAADVDSSEIINIKDASAIQKYAAKLDTDYPIGEEVTYGGGDTPVESSNVPPVTEPSESSSASDTIDLTQLGMQVIVLKNSPYSTPYAHYWTDGGYPGPAWPGEAMTYAFDNYYFILVAEGADRIIFNDGGNGGQTDDLVIPGNFAIYDGATNSWDGYLSDFVDVTKFPINGGITPTTPTQPTDPTEPQPTVTQPVGGDTIDLTQIGQQVIVLKNSPYSTPHAHYWTDGGNPGPAWPGEAMTYAFDNYYYILIAEGADRIIFNGGNSGGQTDDLVIPGNFAIYDGSTNSWSGYLSDIVDVTKFPVSGGITPTPTTPTQPTDPAEGNYIYLRDAAGWGTAYCHYWSSTSGSVWPGEQMESLGNNLYRIALGTDSTGQMYQNVVFNNNGAGKQTADLTVQIGKAYNNATNTWENV